MTGLSRGATANRCGHLDGAHRRNRLIAYGAVFVWRNFNGFIELGLTPQHVGATPEEIRAFSPRLYNYISHLQIAVAGFIVALGVAVVSLAWNGMRRGCRWAALTVLTVVLVASLITLPLHYVYGLATLGHLGSLYVAVALLVIGSLLSLRVSGRTAGPSAT